MSESEGLNMEQSRERFANEVDVALAQSARPFAIHNARKVDARGVAEGAADIFLEIVMQPFLGFDGIVPDSSSPATV